MIAVSIAGAEFDRAGSDLDLLTSSVGEPQLESHLSLLIPGTVPGVKWDNLRSTQAVVDRR